MKNNTEIMIVNENNLKDKIYIIRGQKVMLDSDLAKIYGYNTKRFNEQVQRNIEKFEGDDFMFQLTRDETNNLARSQFATSPNIPISKGNNEGNSVRSKNLTSPKSTMFKSNNNDNSVRCQIGTSPNILVSNSHNEDNSVKSQIATSPNITYFKGQNGGVRKLPYVFSEQGIYMLMTVLKGPLAIKQSRALIRLFKSMKDYLVENRELISNKELELRTQLLEKDVKDIKQDNKDIKIDLKKVMDNFKDPSSYKHFLILDGKKLEADIAYKNIFKLAKKSIIYIDNYIGLKTLELLSYARNNVSITIFSDNKSKPSLTKSMIDDFNTQNKTNNLSLYKSSLKFHDRYIIIDFNTPKEIIYHCGASLKDAGNKITTIVQIEEKRLYKKEIKNLLKNRVLKLK